MTRQEAVELAQRVVEADCWRKGQRGLVGVWRKIKCRPSRGGNYVQDFHVLSNSDSPARGFVIVTRHEYIDGDNVAEHGRAVALTSTLETLKKLKW